MLKYSLLLLLFISCSTPYQRLNITGGYSSKDFPDHYEVTFQGNSTVSTEKAKDFSLLRLTDIAKSNKKTYAVILDSNLKTSTITSLSPGVTPLTIMRSTTKSLSPGITPLVRTSTLFAQTYQFTLSNDSTMGSVDTYELRQKLKKKWGFRREPLTMADLYSLQLSLSAFYPILLKPSKYPGHFLNEYRSAVSPLAAGAGFSLAFDDADALYKFSFGKYYSVGNADLKIFSEQSQSDFQSINWREDISKYTIFMGLGSGRKTSDFRFLFHLGFSIASYNSVTNLALNSETPPKAISYLYKDFSSKFESEHTATGFGPDLSMEFQFKLNSELRLVLYSEVGVLLFPNNSDFVKVEESVEANDTNDGYSRAVSNEIVDKKSDGTTIIHFDHGLQLRYLFSIPEVLQ